ncbi:FAD-binding domain-containing protein [Dichotomopilus funicola]|uniref:ferric-chelate reductase (NADPH) n=1 Tax=Dichotomopilus funicola TaxID=1934379 RepID=A0AAN6UWG4_9PEZI|nr:FAD-binding domain-containing protein [Dichotomopilus funicola]
MDGMDMGSSMFSGVNMDLARRYWYTVAGFVGALVIIRGVNFFKAQQRLRTKAARSVEYPTKPSNWFLELWATLTAVAREVSSSQLHIPFRGFSWLSPPPLGRVIALLVYWIVIIYMMAKDVVVNDVFYWERIGYRNAWVTVSQVPLLYLLASKCSIIGFLVGTSHERLNWLHRWVGRTMFISATVHGWHFYTDWARTDYVEYELKMMPTVKYGFGAWAVLLWTLLSGLAPLRRMAYEIFVLQHLLSAIFFLWLISVHVPATARYNVWFAVAAFSFDRACRLALLLWQNIKVFPDKSKCRGGQRIGHQAQLKAVGDSITVITIKDVHFKWRPGQHLYLWVPRVGLAEAHPYTIACAHQLAGTCICNSIQLVVRKHNGFSRRLHEFASRTDKSEHRTVFVSGPYGAPPRWDIYETIVLISASTGASFTLPILEGLLQEKSTNCVKRVDFLLAARQGDEIGFYVSRLHELIERASEAGIELNVHVAVTQGLSPHSSRDGDSGGNGNVETASASSSGISQVDEKGQQPSGPQQQTSPQPRLSPLQKRTTTTSHTSTDSHVFHSSVRPDIEAFIRGPVEATGGETSVVVCGGPSLVARVRNSVTGLSNERAVHKGTGAQGIHLFAEEYSF